MSVQAITKDDWFDQQHERNSVLADVVMEKINEYIKGASVLPVKVPSKVFEGITAGVRNVLIARLHDADWDVEEADENGYLCLR